MLNSSDADNSPPPINLGLARDTSSPHARRATSRLRWWGFRLAACLGIPAVLLLGTEIVLRFLGVGYPADFLVDLESRPGYLCDNYKFAWRFFPRDMARSPQPIVTTQAKPTETTRIVVFGGSAAMGDPEPAYGLSRMLRTLLKLRFPKRDFEVINAAVTAVNSHVVLSIAQDCRRLNADAWVVYMGNNEVVGPFGTGTVFTNTKTPRWLIRSGLAFKRTKLGQVLSRPDKTIATESWGGMQMFLDHQIRHDDPALDRVYANLDENLDDIVAMARRDGIPIVVSTVVTNLGDCGPFVSLHRQDLSADDLKRWQTHFDLGCRCQTDGRLEEALAAYQAAAKIDPEHAELAYRIAECQRGLGQTDAAREYFVRARDLDGLRFRADSAINETIRAATANRDGVYFLDAAEEFARLSDQQIVGEKFLHEHVHLNFSGNYQLARLVADDLQSALRLQDKENSPMEWASEQRCADELGLSPFHRLTLAQEMRLRLTAPPFDQQAHHERRMQQLDQTIAELQGSLTPATRQQTVIQYQRLIQQDPNDWVLCQQFALLLESAGDLREAVAQDRRVVELLPHFPMGYFQLGALLNRTKQWSEAEAALRQALVLRPTFARALNSLGISLSRQDRMDESIEQFRLAVNVRPTFAEAYLNWGLILAAQGNDEGARERYRAAVKADPDYLPPHVRLGKYYLDTEQFDNALPHYAAIARLQPNDAQIQLNLGMLQLKLGKTPEAKQQFARVLQIAPSNQTAQAALRQIQGSGPPR